MSKKKTIRIKEEHFGAVAQIKKPSKNVDKPIDQSDIISDKKSDKSDDIKNIEKSDRP